ncbi:MAG: DUF4271 domain-containing protein [Paludibacteraceae bacterium]|nr:DUF4271 domain-containing protein [Paludibacteraceae bacterium]
MPLTHPIFNSNLYITFVMLFFVVFGMFIYNYHKSKFNIIATIFTPESVRSFNAPVPNTAFSSVLLAFFALIGYATMLLYVTQMEQTLTNLAICLATSLLFIAIKIPIISLFFNTFYVKKAGGFISRYYKLTVLFGVICFIGGMFISYTFGASKMSIWIITLTIGVLYCASVSYIFISTFFENKGSFLRLFLYLCTLEILPLMVLINEY